MASSNTYVEKGRGEMKKLLILLAASMTILAACGNDEQTNEGTKATTQQTTEETTSTDTSDGQSDADEADEETEEQQTTVTTEDDDSDADNDSDDKATSNDTASNDAKEDENDEADADDATAADLTKPTSLKESANDDSFVLYDAMDTEFMVKRIDYSYKENGPQVKMILLNLYDQYYNTYFNSYAISKDEKTITLDLKESGLTKNNFGASSENNIELLTSLFVNFPKTETIQFKVDGEQAELDNFTTTTRSEWKKMIQSGNYTYTIIED